MTMKDLREFLFENYYKQKGFIKKESYRSLKMRKKDLVLFPTNLTKKYQTLLKLKNSMNYF